MTLDKLFRCAFCRTELAAIARLWSRSFSSSAIFSENGRVTGLTSASRQTRCRPRATHDISAADISVAVAHYPRPVARGPRIVLMASPREYYAAHIDETLCDERNDGRQPTRSTKYSLMLKSTLPALLIGILAWHASTAIADPVSDRITVTVRGTGADVVLIPGLASSSAVWDATATRLEGRYRLHIVEVAGFAGSPPRANAQGTVIQPTVDAIDAYIKTNKLTSPKVIGHSLGGLMGMMLAVQHPDDVGKLMIVDSLPFFSAVFGANDATSVAPQAAMMRDRILNETQDAYAQGERLFLRSLVKSPDGLKAATAWAVASDKSVVARATYEDMTTDLRPKLSEIKTLVTMLYPWDPATGLPPAVVDGLYQKSFAPLPNKTMVRIDGSFHFIMLDQPDAFAAQVDAFLK